MSKRDIVLIFSGALIGQGLTLVFAGFLHGTVPLLLGIIGAAVKWGDAR